MLLGGCASRRRNLYTNGSCPSSDGNFDCNHHWSNNVVLPISLLLGCFLEGALPGKRNFSAKRSSQWSWVQVWTQTLLIDKTAHTPLVLEGSWRVLGGCIVKRFLGGCTVKMNYLLIKCSLQLSFGVDFECKYWLRKLLMYLFSWILLGGCVARMRNL